MEMSRGLAKKNVFKQQYTASKSFLNLPCQKNPLLATGVISHSSMAYNTTASVEKTVCSNSADFRKCQDRLG